ncbi:BTB/POZ and MATH domain-containing protein 1-like [Miscanthus floridulus]|uniref:BTB/POZ and MATH domain-containing protein 1-like n=1 Tax=Miscanthus floridulus TaxID=154761 RepID=UPI00345889D7
MLGTSFIEFKLDYSATKNFPIGKSIVDSRLLAGGRTWTIVCFPRGVLDNGEYLSLCAVTTTTSKSRHGVKAVFQAFPMGRDGAPSLSHAKWSSEIHSVGSNGGTVIGLQKFMKRSELELGCYLVDGCVTFVCGIIDLKSNDRVPVPPTDLGDHLGHLLQCTDGSDVSFSVGGETFCVHRAILTARSPVFKAQLFGSMADAQTDSITLHDVQPEVFRILLRFMYTDTVPTDTDLIKHLEGSSATDLLQHLLAAADMYQLDRLKLMCAQKLWDCVSPETVAATLVCAEMHNCPELKKRCIDFFVVDKNFKSAVLTEGYSRLIQGFPSVIEEIRARLVQP